jgi:hypothetical protein
MVVKVPFQEDAVLQSHENYYAVVVLLHLDDYLNSDFAHKVVDYYIVVIECYSMAY